MPIKDLRIRAWVGPKYHNHHERDLNANINIMFEALKKRMQILKKHINIMCHQVLDF